MTDETSTSTSPHTLYAESLELDAEVLELANYAAINGYSQLIDAMRIGKGEKGIEATAQAIYHFRRSEVFMLRAAAIDLYPRWCEAFGLKTNP